MRKSAGAAGLSGDEVANFAEDLNSRSTSMEATVNLILEMVEGETESGNGRGQTAGRLQAGRPGAVALRKRTG